jgi:hypothetical protein
MELSVYGSLAAGSGHWGIAEAGSLPLRPGTANDAFFQNP